MSTGLFFVRRDSTWIVRRTSSSRPITGSSLPLRARSVQVAAVAGECLVCRLGILRRDALVAATWVMRGVEGVLRRTRRCRSCAAGARPTSVARASEQMLGADELVLQPLRFGLGRIEISFIRGEKRDVAAVRLRQ
jgi:hypothetical protein